MQMFFKTYLINYPIPYQGDKNKMQPLALVNNDDYYNCFRDKCYIENVFQFYTGIIIPFL